MRKVIGFFRKLNDGKYNPFPAVYREIEKDARVEVSELRAQRYCPDHGTDSEDMCYHIALVGKEACM